MSAPASQGWRWLELTLDYRCNLRCVGCRACEDTGEAMDLREIAGRLEAGRRQGISRLWLGGGEPTLRDDLPRVVAAARRMGYREVLVQTNGLRLSYARYLDALVAAGLTDVSVNVKSAQADVHDRLSGRPGALALLEQGLEAARERGLALHADVLLTRSTAPQLVETVERFAALGVTRFLLWLLSASDVADGAVDAEMPHLSEVGPQVIRAAERAEALGARLRSLHTPPCVLGDRADVYLPSAELRMLVANPGQAPFPLERSPMEGGAWVAACEACAARARCGGPRADYLARFGAGELVAIR